MILVPYENETIDYDERVHILTKTRNMVYKLETRIDSRFRAGIGRIREEQNLRESYSEAVQALRETDSHVVHINDIPTNEKTGEDCPEELETRYIQKVLKRDMPGSSQGAEELLDWMEDHYNGNMGAMKIKALELTVRLEQKVVATGGAGRKFNQKENSVQKLQELKSREEIGRWLWEQTREISRNVGSAREKPSESVMEKAKEYIRENFQKDLTLDEVSKVVDISPYYFSKLFKQETGENFIEYLTKVRMKNAEELLKDSSYSIKEICTASGYGDPNYFSRIFKKYEGVTPSEYRERLG